MREAYERGRLGLEAALLVETGVLGLVSFCWLIVRAGLRTFRRLRSDRAGNFVLVQSLILAFLLAAVLALATEQGIEVELVMLAGIVVNDAIVKIDYTNQVRRSGKSVREAILAALREASGVRARAARILGMGRTTLWRKMKEHGIEVEEGPTG